MMARPTPREASVHRGAEGGCVSSPLTFGENRAQADFAEPGLFAAGRIEPADESVSFKFVDERRIGDVGFAASNSRSVCIPGNDGRGTFWKTGT